VNYQVLVEELRPDLCRRLGLEPIRADLVLPPAGPGRMSRKSRSGEGARRGASAHCGGTAAGAGEGGLGTGPIAGDAASSDAEP
jgi:hypothetical protein